MNAVTVACTPLNVSKRMPRYEIKIDERFYHSLTIEAASQDEAVELAYKLLTDGMSKEQETEYDYIFESEGFTGEHSTYEI
jgi:hypothetical protein